MVSDQWVFSPSGTMLGLNSAAIWPVLNALGLGLDAYNDVRKIADGALRALKEQRDKKEE